MAVLFSNFSRQSDWLRLETPVSREKARRKDNWDRKILNGQIKNAISQTLTKSVMKLWDRSSPARPLPPPQAHPHTPTMVPVPRCLGEVPAQCALYKQGSLKPCAWIREESNCCVLHSLPRKVFLGQGT